MVFVTQGINEYLPSHAREQTDNWVQQSSPSIGYQNEIFLVRKQQLILKKN